MRAAKFGIIGVFFGLVLSASALGGPLNGHVNAYNDGFGPSAGAWTGSTPFAISTFTGFVDYAVFAPGDFPYAGYTPTAAEMTYAYQVYVTGTSALSSFSVSLVNPADNIGSFVDLAGDAPTSMAITPGVEAQWLFSGIVQGGNSRGLAFSSPRVPMEWFGTTVNQGLGTTVFPLPSPSENNIPEPAAAGLLGSAASLLLLERKRRA